MKKRIITSKVLAISHIKKLAKKTKKKKKLGRMEVIFLIECASAWGQCEGRSTPIIRHTETSLDVSHCATVSDVTVDTAGEALDEEVLSARV